MSFYCALDIMASIIVIHALLCICVVYLIYTTTGPIAEIYFGNSNTTGLIYFEWCCDSPNRLCSNVLFIFANFLDCLPIFEDHILTCFAEGLFSRYFTNLPN